MGWNSGVQNGAEARERMEAEESRWRMMEWVEVWTLVSFKGEGKAQVLQNPRKNREILH